MTAEERPIAVIVLAAGQGTRMNSSLPKVLHPLCGRSMLGHVVETAENLAPERLIVVVGRGADEVTNAFKGRCEFVLQEEQLGTGHAVMQAAPKLDGFDGDVLVLYGDVPLLTSETLKRMRAEKLALGADLLILSANALTIPGRIVRDEKGHVERVVEKQDATDEELAISERNTGVYLLDSALLRECLGKLEANNAQGELYLTDAVRHSVLMGRRVDALLLEDADQCLGINDRRELAQATAVLRRRIADKWLTAGVTMIDPDTTYIDADVEIGRDTVIEPGCVIQGPTVIGERCHLKAYTTIESSRLENDVAIGPNSHLRPDSHLGEGVRIGNFVEVKNAVLGPGTKAAHLTYIGDADIGARVNFGCGVVVVNYDGIGKYRTSVGDDVFIGCNANLLSPVTLQNHCFIAAGSTISKEVPEDALGVARAKQRNVEGWYARREEMAARMKADKAETAGNERDPVGSKD